MQTLEEQVLQLQKKNIDKMPKSISLEQATRRDDLNSILEAMPSYKDNPMERFAKGAISGLQSMSDIVPSLEIYGQQVDLAIGGYFGAKPETIERKALNLATSYRNLQAKQQERFKYTNPEDANSWAFGIGQGAFNYGLMLVGGGLVGAGVKAAGASAAAKIAATSATGLTANALLENVEQQSERMPLNQKNQVDVEQITPEWARSSAIGTTAYLGISTLLERGFGFGKQVKMWETPVKTSNKAIKVSSPVIKQAAKTALSEGMTEGLQSLASTGILLAEGKIDVSQLPERLQDAWKEAVIGGLLGGTAGTAVGINQAHNVKTMLNEEISKVITDPEECEKVVEAIYDSGTIEMTNVISKELELSSELNNKHGAIYDSMQGAIYDAINNSGAFQGIEEAEIAQYVSDTAKMFANQVLAEANKRGVLIDEVLKAGDIKYENGKILLQAGKDIIAETPVVSEEVSAEIVTEEMSSEDRDIKTNLEAQIEESKKKAKNPNFYDGFNVVVKNGIVKVEKNGILSKSGFQYNKGATTENTGANWNIDAIGNLINKWNNENGQTKLFQSAAMYKERDAQNIKEFYNKVQKMPDDINKVKYSIPNKKISIPASAMHHANVEHNLTDTDWENIVNNIDNIFIAGETKDANAYSKENYRVGIKAGNKYYGLIIGIENKDNYIATAFPNTKNGVEAWVNEKGKTPSKVLSEKSAEAPLSKRSSNDIITYLKQNLNPNDKLNQLKDNPKQPKIYKGSYSVSQKAIELFKDADYSTLPHEFAHFWLDNMWQFARSGKASEAYKNNFQGVLDWLGVKDNQINLTTAQQEKFARGYEKYLYNGYAPNGLIQGAFDDYDKWLQKVYKDAKELRVKLNADAIEFFDTMTTGELPEYDIPETQAEIREKNIEQVNKDIQEARKFVVEKQTEYNNYDNGNTITKDTVPVTTEGEKRQSKAYTNQAAILGIAEQLDYNKANIEEQNKLATDFVKNNFDEARQVVMGEKEAPSDILKNAIYNAYLKEMLAIGDNDAYIEALRNQSLELTRAGQEIASQRGAIENIFDSGYWIRRIENLKKMRLAAKKFGGVTGAETEEALSKMNNYIKNKVDEVMPQFMEATEEEQKQIAEKLSKEIAAEFKAKSSDTLYQSMREPSELRTRTNAYNYLYRYINGALGLELTRAQSNEIIAKTQAIQKAIETTRNRNGNPSALFFKNISEMEAYANSIEPSPALAILTSTVGRGNMLFSPKTILLNIESNIVNFFTEAVTRRIANQAANAVVDNQVIKDYLAYSREVFNTSGYQVSSMPTLDPTTQILSEKMTTTGGKGIANSLGRFFEQTIFKYGLGAPDLYFKDMTFIDTANLLASKEAKGDAKKATELFKDICLIEPKTAAGKRIREIAINEALVATYQNKGKISELALGIRNAFNKVSGQLHIGDMLSPFVKTPANVIGLGFDYSMGGLLALKNIETIYNDIKNGTFTDTTRNSLRSLSRNGIGFVAAMLIASMIDDDDYIPDYALLNPKERELVKLKGGVFNSIKIGNKYVSLDYFGPLAMPLVSVLNARRGKDVKSKVWDYFQGSAYQALKLPVVGDLKDLLEGTGRTLTKDVDTNIKTLFDASVDFISSRAIPAIVTDIAKMTDEYERETNNDAIKRLQSKIPVWREELPAQYNYGTGRARETQNPVSILLTGARVKEEISSSVIREINKLDKKNTEEKVGLSKVTKTGKLSELKESQKIKVEKQFAKRYATEVNQLIHTNKYSALDNNEKVKAINKVRDSIRDDLKVEYGLAKPKKKRSKNAYKK